MTSNIAIIGAGGIGSRHLQGLSKLERQIKLIVIDPSKSAIERARSLHEETCNDDNIQSVEYHKSLKKPISSSIDLAIISTNSDVRRTVIEQLIEVTNVRYILIEKIAFQSAGDFKAIIKLIEKKGIKAWVNCPRRIFDSYIWLERKIRSNEPLTMVVDGKGWGLASNSVHMIDLFSFLTGERYVSIDKVELDNKIYNSKRNGFIEFRGSLEFYTKRGDSLILNDRKKKTISNVIRIEGTNFLFLVFEQQQKMVNIDFTNYWRPLLPRWLHESQ